MGSEIDHTYLCHFARLTSPHPTPLSHGLYTLLGLSTLLSRKLLRARKQRKLDLTRPTKSLELYHHILWLSTQGRAILHSDIIPYIPPRAPELLELRVLIRKLLAGYEHIFVLFDEAAPGRALECFSKTEREARGLGMTHPLALSAKVEYCAFLKDCVGDYERGARMAREAVEGAWREWGGRLGSEEAVEREYNTPPDEENGADGDKWWGR